MILDLPNKILTNQAKSAAYSYFEQDFSVNYVQAITQMREASALDWSECKGDPCFG